MPYYICEPSTKNDNRNEEVVIVSKLIHEVEADETMEYDGF